MEARAPYGKAAEMDMGPGTSPLARPFLFPLFEKTKVAIIDRIRLHLQHPLDALLDLLILRLMARWSPQEASRNVDAVCLFTSQHSDGL